MTVTKQNVFKKTNLKESKQRVTIPPVKVITILMKLVKKETLACDDKFKFPSLHGLLIWVFAQPPWECGGAVLNDYTCQLNH